MKKKNPINSIIAIVLSFLATIALIVILAINPEIDEETGHTMAALIVAIVAIFDLAICLFEKGYLKAEKRLGGVNAAILVALCVVFMIVEIDPRVITTCFALADVILGISNAIVCALEIKENKLEIVGLLVALGFAVFGTMLIFEGVEGLRTHLIFDCFAFSIEGALKVIEFVKEKKLEGKEE